MWGREAGLDVRVGTMSGTRNVYQSNAKHHLCLHVPWEGTSSFLCVVRFVPLTRKAWTRTRISEGDGRP